jgi:hypothetical protein
VDVLGDLSMLRFEDAIKRLSTFKIVQFPPGTESNHVSRHP